jgi:hypothetical protein
MSASYVPPYRRALEAAASSAAPPATATPKPADGVVQLKPMRGADLIRQAHEAAALSAAAAPTAAPTASRYVPPSKRGAEPPKPKTLTTQDMASAELFPTLGGPRAAAAAAAPAPASTNAFAVLDDDASSVSASTTAPLNFKKTLKATIKKEREEAEAAAALAAIPETDDPNEMTVEQLERNGWTVLRRPFGSQPDALQGLEALRDFVEKHSAGWVDGPADPELAYYENGETWTTMGIPPELLEMGKERELMAYCCRTHGEEVPDYAAIAEQQRLATLNAKMRTTSGLSSKMQDLMQRKKAHRALHGPGEAERRAMALPESSGPVGSLDAMRAGILA